MHGDGGVGLHAKAFDAIQRLSEDKLARGTRGGNLEGSILKVREGGCTRIVYRNAIYFL